MMRQKNIYFLFLLLAILITGFVVALGYSPRARLFPLIAISACGLLVLGELLIILRGGDKGAAPAGGAGTAALQPRGKFFLVLLWLGSFTFALWFLGFMVGLPLFVFAYIKTHEKGWLWALVLTAVMFVIVYIGFGRLLDTPLYEGWIFLQ